MGALVTEEVGVMPISETEQTAPVTSLPADAADSWAAGSIERWNSTGIVKGDGDGNFNPNAQLSRAELAQIFVNMLGLTEKAENTFADLSGGEWYADAILKCVAAGIMKGDGKSVNAETNISRGETIVMFGRAVGVTPDAEPDLSEFTDADAVADWAAGYMAPLVKMGILSGSGDGTINAIGEIDRASTMSLLDKAVGEYVNAPGEYEAKDANKFVVVNMSAKEGEIVISGTTAGVAVSAGTGEGKIVAKNLTADTIKMDGAAALNVEGKSSVGEVVSNATGVVAIAKEVTVDTVTVTAANATTNIAGTVKNVAVQEQAKGATLTVEKTAKVDTVKTDAPESKVAINAPVKSVEAGAAAAGTSVDVAKGVTVDTVKTDSAINLDNKGTVKNAEVNADGVKMDGNKPTQTVVPDSVTEKPATSDGKEIPSVKPEDAKPVDKIPEDKPSTGGGSTGGSSTVTVTGIIAAPLHDTADAEVDVYAIADADMPTVAVQATKNTNTGITTMSLSANKDIPVHKNGENAMGAWVGVGIPVPADVADATAVKLSFAKDDYAATTGTIPSFDVVDAKNYITFYVNLAGEPKTYIAIDWDGEGAKTVEKYRIDLGTMSANDRFEVKDNDAYGSFEVVLPLGFSEAAGKPVFSRLTNTYYIVVKTTGGQTIPLHKSGAGSGASDNYGYWAGIKVLKPTDVTGQKWDYSLGSDPNWEKGALTDDQGNLTSDPDNFLAFWPDMINAKTDTYGSKAWIKVQWTTDATASTRNYVIDVSGVACDNNFANESSATTIDKKWVVGAGATVTIPAGKTVTIAAETGNLVLKGTLIVEGTLINSGTITNSGTLTVNGTLVNNGTLTNTGTKDGTGDSIGVTYAETSIAALETSLGNDAGKTSTTWDKVITATHYYDTAKTYVEALDNSDAKTALAGRLTAVANKFAAITALDMAGKTESRFDISSDALRLFTKLTKLDISGTGLTEFTGLTGMTAMQELSLAGLTDFDDTDLGAIAAMPLTKLNLSGTSVADIGPLSSSDMSCAATLVELDISATDVTLLQGAFWVSNAPAFTALKTLNAKRLELTSISGLVEIVNAEGFEATGITWNLETSTLTADGDNAAHVARITTVLSTGFTAPTLPSQE